MSTGVSVVICCHNSAKRLPETLRHLAAQQVPEGIPWEIIVIDNASTDGTADTALRHQVLFHPVPLRVIDEPVAGLSHARVRGVREARHEIISFIDDDNWIAADWVERVNTIFAQQPEIGVCGGRVEAVCEIEPPAWFERIKGFYAVGSQHKQSGDVTNAPGTLLWGAGLSMRTSASRKLLDDGFIFMLSGRKGKSMLTGEDTELCFALRESGWHFWYDDALVLRHFIPKERLQWSYALRLMRGMGEASALVELYLFALNRPPFEGRPAWKKSWLFSVMKAARHLGAVILSHPSDCYRQPEGSPHALNFKMCSGRWATLWALCGRYKKLGEKIRQSAWVHVKSKA
jgi:glycosyltransferase involved in cell wall biosynthesis